MFKMTRASYGLMIGVVMLLAFVHQLAAFEPMPDFPGPYCETSRTGCCRDREDDCALPISNTLCYCDDFCDRSTAGDCCPDYMSYCKGEPADLVVPTCTHRGQRFTQFDGPIRDNCNECRCDQNGDLHCGRDLCLVDEDLIHNVNQLRHSAGGGWEARNYTQFWGRKFDDGRQLRLGTFEPKHKVKEQSKLVSRAEHELPRHFNAVDRWGAGMISPVRDQGWCGSSWAVSTASVASDRFAVLSQGKEAVVLSPQQMLSCMQRQQGCNGGHLDRAWNYLRKVGVVDDECFPYIEGTNRCKVPSRVGTTLSTVGCSQQTKVKRQSLFKMGPAYALRNEADIMFDIEKSGPVQATMRVYRDFFSYGGGIYRHTRASRSEPTGFHSVRLMGWGEEDNGESVTKYWIAANSWGTWWGENGYFRILRGQNECEIENYVLGSWADVTTKQQRNSSSKPQWYQRPPQHRSNNY